MMLAHLKDDEISEERTESLNRLQLIQQNIQNSFLKFSQEN